MICFLNTQHTPTNYDSLTHNRVVAHTMTMDYTNDYVRVFTQFRRSSHRQNLQRHATNSRVLTEVFKKWKVNM